MSAPTPLDTMIAAARAAHPGESGFRLIVEGPEAFALRVHTARRAVRSLDVQTYAWHCDATGMFLAHEILLAADRGVCVRLLLDALHARRQTADLAALAAHPRIEVRAFNPLMLRGGPLAMVRDLLQSFGRLNRRMHNKTWIVDGCIAVAGGRNIGNEYFDASELLNFSDLDLAMVGPIVADAAASFQRYWTASAARPLQELDPAHVHPQALEKLRARLQANAKAAEASRYGVALQTNDAVRRLMSGDWPLEWTEKYTFVADDPGKVAMRRCDPARTAVGEALLPLLERLRAGVDVVSPYFVPAGITGRFVDAVERGRRVRVLTNSLAATDVAAVHGGYSHYRRTLLEGHVDIWELKPVAGAPRASLFGSSGASLHSKALCMDGCKVFVGSYNLDPRSTWLNCEQGVLVESRVLAAELDRIFAAQTDGACAWRVTLENGGLRWNDGKKTFATEPGASRGRRLQAWLSQRLGLEAQL